MVLDIGIINMNLPKINSRTGAKRLAKLTVLYNI